MFKFTSKLKIAKGGEMMRTLGLVLVMMMVLTGAAFAASTTISLVSGSNLMGPTLVPFDPNPEVCWDELQDPYAGFIPPGSMTRWDPVGGSFMDYDMEASPFNILLGDGYWVTASADVDLVYDGVPNGVPDSGGIKTDMWLSLPGLKESPTNLNSGGAQIISTPYDEEVSCDNVYFTDGTTLKSWMQAASDGWVGISMTYFQGGSFGDIYPENGDILSPGWGYWVQTYKDDLAMIVVANNE